MPNNRVKTITLCIIVFLILLVLSPLCSIVYASEGILRDYQITRFDVTEYDIPEEVLQSQSRLPDFDRNYLGGSWGVDYTQVEKLRIIIHTLDSSDMHIRISGPVWEPNKYRDSISAYLARTGASVRETDNQPAYLNISNNTFEGRYNSLTITGSARGSFEQGYTVRFRKIEGEFDENKISGTIYAYYVLFSHDEAELAENANNPYLQAKVEFEGVREGGVAQAGTTTTIIDTEAEETPGVTSNPVQRVIVVGLAGLVAAAAGTAGAAGAAGSATGGAGGTTAARRREDEEESLGSSYRMILNKNFGNQIKTDGEAYYVYARMLEITPQGHEVARDDLTSMIEIFPSSNNVQLGEPVMTGGYMGVGVIAVPENQQIELSKNQVTLIKNPKQSAAHTETVEISLEDINQEAVISFRFTGEGGIFQNNVTFYVTGDDWEIDADLRYDYDLEKVDLAIENKENNRATLQITEAASRLEESHSNTSADIQIIAKNKVTEISRVIKAYIWQEGIFVTNTKQERNPDGSFNIKADGEQEKREIMLQVIVWDEEKKTADNKPELLNPESLQIEWDPPNQETKNVIEVCELICEHASTAHSFAVYDFYAKNELTVDGKDFILPVNLSIKGKDPEIFTKQISFKIEPVDLEAASAERRIEIQRCNRIIDNHVPVAHREKLREILDRQSQVLGPEGLYELRRRIWNVAQNLILAEGAEGYKDVERWADRIVTVLEWAEWAGKHCFDVVVKVKLGPKAVPAANFIRSMMIESIKAYYYENQDPLTWLRSYVDQVYDSINFGKLFESGLYAGGEKGWKQFCDYLKEQNIVIRGSGWRVEIPGWLAVKVLVAMRKFITEWYLNNKSIYEASKATIWDLTDGVVGDYLENLLKEKGDYNIFQVADAEI